MTTQEKLNIVSWLSVDLVKVINRIDNPTPEVVEILKEMGSKISRLHHSLTDELMLEINKKYHKEES